MARDSYQKLVSAAEFYLKNKISSSEAPVTSAELITAMRAKINAGQLDVDLTDGTMLNYISTAANSDETSGIRSGGPRGGYWFESIDETTQAEAHNIQSGEAVSGAKSGEGTLYPLLQLWLKTMCDLAKDVSSLKGGGKWGNPDIVGFTRSEMLGAIEVEIHSIEVKIDSENWERQIFEAVSHKRFSNRSWFAYREKTDFAALPKGMEYYAERFRVGIVQICLTDDELQQLKEASTDEAKLLKFVDKIRIRIPALFDPVPMIEKTSLAGRVGVTILSSLTHRPVD